jgi:hypothetical protein
MPTLEKLDRKIEELIALKLSKRNPANTLIDVNTQ